MKLIIVIILAFFCIGWMGITYKEEALEYANQFPNEWYKAKSDLIVVWRTGVMSRDVVVPRGRDFDVNMRCPECGKYNRECEILSYKKDGPIWAWFYLKCPECGVKFKLYEQITQCEIFNVK